MSCTKVSKSVVSKERSTFRMSLRESGISEVSTWPSAPVLSAPVSPLSCSAATRFIFIFAALSTSATASSAAASSLYMPPLAAAMVSLTYVLLLAPAPQAARPEISRRPVVASASRRTLCFFKCFHCIMVVSIFLFMVCSFRSGIHLLLIR